MPAALQYSVLSRWAGQRASHCDVQVHWEKQSLEDAVRNCDSARNPRDFLQPHQESELYPK